MYHEFSGILEQAGLWRREGTVLLAVSGGIDSMCMADLFRRTGLPFAIAHCNFHLRGEESDADEALVRDWAAANGVAFHAESFDTAAFASSADVSIEMAARELRYRWFARLSGEHGYKVLCVAHNANDNAETLLLNIARGTGMKGLSGMAAESVSPYSAPEYPLRLVRPLLSFTRRQIEGYVRAHSVPYREDRTNAGTEYRRNKIRHLVLPVMEQMNPSFIRTVSDEMRYFAQAGSIADSYYRNMSASLVKEDGDEVSMDLSGLLSAGNWEYILYRFLDTYGFNSSVVSSLTDLLKSGRTISGKHFHSADYILLTASGRLIVKPLNVCRTVKSPAASPVPDVGNDSFVAVRGPGNYCCNGVSFSVSVEDRRSFPSLRQPAGILLFDADVLKFPFVCRTWREGDWFVPLGMKGKKKVSDFFTDLKYDIFRKEAAVMVADTADSRRIAAVLGERPDDRFKVTSGTSRILVIRIAGKQPLI